MPGFARGYAVAGFVLAQGSRTKPGGADRDRTDDLLNAIQALSQLSYGPTGRHFVAKGGGVCQSTTTFPTCDRQLKLI